jgi:hypothetical protein
MLPSLQPITRPGYASHGSAFRSSEPSRHTIRRPWFLRGIQTPIETLAPLFPHSTRRDLPSLPPLFSSVAAAPTRSVAAAPTRSGAAAPTRSVAAAPTRSFRCVLLLQVLLGGGFGRFGRFARTDLVDLRYLARFFFLPRLFRVLFPETRSPSVVWSTQRVPCSCLWRRRLR